MRYFLLLVSFAAVAFGQRLSFGVVGGGTLTDAFPTQSVPSGSPSLPFNRFYSSSKDWVLGGTAEFRFRPSLSVEVDGLYRKLHFTTAAVTPDGSLNSVSPSPVVTWEFPVLAKYRVQWSNMNPFVELGPSFRTTGNLNGTNPSHYGITAGAGLEVHLGSFDLAPVLRYTRWAQDGLDSFHPNSSPDQVELLVAFSRSSELKSHPWGQRLSLGVIAGATLRNDLQDTVNPALVAVPQPGGGYTLQSGTSTNSGLKSFLIGPTLEFRLPKDLSLQVDALYHPLRYFAEQRVDDGAPLHTSTFNEAVTWELPVLAKYRLRGRSTTPFVEAGPSFRLPQDANGPLSTYGLVVGAGVDIRVGRIRIAPVLRYTHWASDRTGGTKNQLGALVGISF